MPEQGGCIISGTDMYENVPFFPTGIFARQCIKKHPSDKEGQSTRA